MEDNNKSYHKGNDPKAEQLKAYTSNHQGEFLNTNQGLKINDDQNSLKSGDRGATLLEDFILREKNYTF